MAYSGNCHCGGYRFEISDDGFETEQTVCSCEACAKLGPIWRVVSPDAVKVVRDAGKLEEYRSRSLEYKFCSVCGTAVFGIHFEGSLKHQTAVNLRSLRDFNPFEHKETSVLSKDSDSGSWPSKGSCLCGKVTVALLAPLQDMPIKEDNCSICTRNAWIGAYPPKAQVSLQGTEHVEDYRFGRRFVGHPFCRTCGVHVYMNIYGPPQTVLDRLPEDKKVMVRKNLDLAPVNIRVLDGSVIGRLPVERTDEGQEGYSLDEK